MRTTAVVFRTVFLAATDSNAAEERSRRCRGSPPSVNACVGSETRPRPIFPQGSPKAFHDGALAISTHNVPRRSLRSFPNCDICAGVARL